MIIQTILLVGAVVVGGGLAFAVSRMFSSIFNLILAFTGAFVLGVSVLELLPFVFHSHVANAGIWIIAGFLIQLILDYLSAGLEHGHVHPVHNISNRLMVQLLVGLCLHAFLEGLPLGGHFHAHDLDHNHENHFLWALILHKAPAAFALGYVLLTSGVRKWTVLFLLILFAAMTPLGQFTGYLTGMSENTTIVLTAMVIGSFLHISTTVLFETDRDVHQFSTRKLVAVLLGFVVVRLTL